MKLTIKKINTFIVNKYYLFSFIPLILYILIFSVLIFNDKYVINDYVYVPQQTKLESQYGFVDDVEFINSNLQKNGIFDDRPHEKNNLKAGREEILSFIKKNTLTKQQIEYRGYYFYHHAYSFLPIHGLAMGIEANKFPMIYGWLSTLSQVKILKYFGVNFQNYLNLFYGGYILYFLLFVTSIHIIFKNHTIFGFGLFLGGSSLLWMGIELIKLAPGLNPIRHLFDPLIFISSFCFFRSQRLEPLIVAILISIFSVLWSKDFGIYISVALGVACIIYANAIEEKYRSLYRFGIVSYLLTVLIIFFLKVPGENSSAIYFILGVGSPSISNLELSIFSISIAFLLRYTFSMEMPREYKYVSILAAFYSIFSFTYYLWYPKLHHLYGVATIYIYWVLLLMYANLKNNILISIVRLATIIFFVVAIISFFNSVFKSDKYYKNHVIHDLDINGNKLKSIGDPSVYVDSVNIINKFSKDEPFIFMISKYDNILSILSNKYLNVGNVELWSNIVSMVEIQKIIDKIYLDNPKYIYVDNDLMVDFYKNHFQYENIRSILTNMRGYGIGRDLYYGISPLKLAYLNISEHYYVCHKGLIISVLCRSN